MLEDIMAGHEANAEDIHELHDLIISGEFMNTVGGLSQFTRHHGSQPCLPVYVSSYKAIGPLLRIVFVAVIVLTSWGKLSMQLSLDLNRLSMLCAKEHISNLTMSSSHAA